MFGTLKELKLIVQCQRTTSARGHRRLLKSSTARNAVRSIGLQNSPRRAPNTGPFFAVVLDCRSRYRSQVERGRSSAFRVGSVARTCTICSHPKLVSIDRQLLRGDMLNSIAHRFHVSPDAVGRHRRHMRTAMLKAQAAAEKQDLVYGQTLIDEVKAIKADAERLQLEAEGRRDIKRRAGGDS